MRIKRDSISPFTAGISVISISFICFAAVLIPSVNASSAKTDQHLVTIYDRGVEKSVISKKDSLKEVLAENNIQLDTNDIIEPKIDEELVAPSYKVNIYRARPITIVDDTTRLKVMTAAQTPAAIVKSAKLAPLQDEDKTRMQLSSDFVSNGASLELEIQRSTPVTLVLYGQKSKVFTQSKTVAGFLEEKGINLSGKDTLSVKKSATIRKNMTIEIWRNGRQTVTKKEKIDFDVREIKDATRKVGYRNIETAGTPGQKIVTYEIVMKNGKELKRRAIETVIVKKAKEQVERVGTKPSFGGDFAAALAKLRACEGGYNSLNPAGPYYGAYQFDRGTWASVTDAPYGNASPAEQDAAARKLYERRGWSPWPVCGAGLPDTFR